MKKTPAWLIFLLLITILPISFVAAQSSYSNDSLAVFYPAAYDPVQTQPSFAIQQEPAVQPGAPGNWKLTPYFYLNNSSQNCALVNCGKSIDFYGTGEVTGNLRRNNTTINLWNTDNYNYGSYSGAQLYQSHPWVLGVRADGTAFGVIADNTWQMTINITDTSILFTSQGPVFRVLTFEAATPQEAIKGLATLTGKMSLPPVWSLGYHQCRYSYMSETEVKSIADSFRSNQLPCDVIWMDIDYMDGYKIFTFSPTAFPDPTGLNAYLHNKKFKSVWMIDPGVKQQSGYSIYDQGTSGDHWVQNNTQTAFVGNVWPGKCVFPDFTMTATRNWWAGLYKNFMATGIDGVWNDMNEPSVFGGPGGTMPITNIHRGSNELPKASHLRYHNVYGRLMVQSSRDGIIQANPTKRPFVLSRANFLGGQQFAATWTGDNVASVAHMKLSVPMILTLGLSGQPFSGADVTGYTGNCTADLFGHWMSLGTFYPFYRNHAEKGSNRREPWAFGAAMKNVARTALQRRYRLLPYLYTLAQEASVNGMPVMRPLFFADPKDAYLRNQQQAFLLGDILMIIPKWAANVNMPAGLWNSISLVGENSKTDTYQPDVLLKAGSILPLGQVIQNSTDYTTDSLSLIASLDKNSEATGYLYTDSGEGYAYQEGQYSVRTFRIKPYGNDSLILTSVITAGQLPQTNQHIRVGLATSNGTAYSNWTTDTVIIIPRSFTAYAGTIRNIPGKIEAEDYDTGTEGFTYHDADIANQGGKYRNDGVDIETCNEGGYNVGWTEPGESLTYTVNVLYPGTYRMEARVASGLANKAFHVELDGVNISGKIVVPNTGGWQIWATVAVATPDLTPGQKVLRIVMETDEININYINFSLLNRGNCSNNTSFVATISATGNAYQWQVDTGTGYTNIVDGTVYFGAKKDTLIFYNAPPSMYGNVYRCMVTNGGISYSQEYVLQFGNTWTGAVDTAWENPGNWSCGSVPGANADVFINSGTVVVNSNVTIRSIRINAGVVFTVNPGRQFGVAH